MGIKTPTTRAPQMGGSVSSTAAKAAASAAKTLVKGAGPQLLKVGASPITTLVSTGLGVAGCAMGGVALYKNHQTQKAVEAVQKETTKAVNDLNQHKENTQTALETLTRQLEAERKARAALETKLTDAIADVKDDLKKDIEAQDAKIKGLEDSIKAIKEGLNAMNTRLDATDAKVDQLEAFVSGLAVKVGDIEATQQKLISQVNSVMCAMKIDKQPIPLLALLDEYIKLRGGFENLDADPLFVGKGCFNRKAMLAKIRHQPCVVIIAKIDDDWVFGVYYSDAIKEFNTKTACKEVVVFRFEPNKEDNPFEWFEPQESQRGHFTLQAKAQSTSGIINIGCEGGGQLWIGNEESDSYCEDLTKIFMMTTDDALTGRTGRNEDNFYHVQDLIALRLKAQCPEE